MDSEWSYEAAFSRHAGIVTPEEQEILRYSCVAIAGLGGVGGAHLMTLARLGIGSFHIADFDRFECANFNRQYGATLGALGRPKVEVMAELASEVNPELKLKLFAEGLTAKNIDSFLSGVDLVIDGLDFFALDARRRLFREARARGLWVLTAGPFGAGAGWLLFSPQGMSFDRYFDLHDEMNELEQNIAFAVGVAPQLLHLKYIDLKKCFSVSSKSAGSLGLACNLAAGIAAAQTLKILLGRPGLRAAPWYGQFDAYRGICRQRYLVFGNRHPWQRLKRWWLRRTSAYNRTGKATEIPASAGLPVLGKLWQFARDPIAFHDELLRRFGSKKMFTFRICRRRYFVLNDPKYIEELFVKDQDAFVKDGRFIRVMRKLTGINLLTREGADHLRVRRICQQAFTKTKLRAYAEYVFNSVRNLTERWRPSEVIDLQRFCSAHTLDVIAQSMFSVTVEDGLDETTRALKTISEYICNQMRPFSRLRVLWHRREERDLRSALSTIDGKLSRLLSIRDNESAGEHDLIAVLNRARGSESAPCLTPEEIRAEALTMFMVGQETIATALTWTMYLLARYPSAQERLWRELEEVTGGRALCYEDVGRLPYASSVFKESMRIFPPIWALTRQLAADRRLDDVELPKGAQIVVSPYMLQRNPANFAAPLAFTPERWLEPGAERAAGYTYLPFGAGRRVCIGKTFSEMEGILTLAAICRSFRIELVSEEEPGCCARRVTLQPKKRIYLRMNRRAEAKGRDRAVRQVPG